MWYAQLGANGIFSCFYLRMIFYQDVCLFAVVIKYFMIGVNVWWVYLAPKNIPRAISVLALGNKVILYCEVFKLTVPVPNKPSRFCGRKAKCTRTPAASALPQCPCSSRSCGSCCPGTLCWRDQLGGEPTLFPGWCKWMLCYGNRWLVTSFMLPNCFLHSPPRFPTIITDIMFIEMDNVISNLTKTNT